MCPRITKSGNNVLFPNLALSQEWPKLAMYMFPNLALSGVARNGNGVCPRIPKSGNKITRKKGTADYIYFLMSTFLIANKYQRHV